MADPRSALLSKDRDGIPIPIARNTLLLPGSTIWRYIYPARSPYQLLSPSWHCCRLSGRDAGKRFGDKQIAILGLTLMVVGGLLDGTSMNYATFFGGRLIAGIGAVLLNVLLLKMATDWFVGREIGTALALLVTSWPVGIGIALIVLPWIAITFSVPSAFLSTAVAAAVVLVLVAAIYRPPAMAATCPKGDRASAFRGERKDWCHWRVLSGRCLMSAASSSSASRRLC